MSKESSTKELSPTAKKAVSGKGPSSAPERAKSDIDSPNMRPGFTKILGGMPPEKHVEEIDKINQPDGRKRAPGSVRV